MTTMMCKKYDICLAVLACLLTSETLKPPSSAPAPVKSAIYYYRLFVIYQSRDARTKGRDERERDEKKKDADLVGDLI